MKIKFIRLYILLSVLVGCSAETSVPKTEYRIEITESFTHEENLRVADFDKKTNSFLLGYWDSYDEKTKYAIHDKNFNLQETGFYDAENPHSIVMINSKVFVGGNTFNFYKTSNSWLIRKYGDLNTFNEIEVFDNDNINRTANFWFQFQDYLNSFFDTKDYIIFSSHKKTCYIIRKSDFEVISFEDFFEENNTIGSGGHGIGQDEKGNIILSTRNHGVLVYENNEWQPFLNGELNQFGRRYWQIFKDSKNRLFANSGDEIIVYDLNLKEKMITIKGTYSNGSVKLSGSRILGEHPDGSILLYTDPWITTNRIFKFQILKN